MSENDNAGTEEKISVTSVSNMVKKWEEEIWDVPGNL